MALVDFHQLAILYKLACEDVPVLSNSLDPPQMKFAPRKSRSTAIGFGQIPTYLVRSLPVVPKTPTSGSFPNPYQSAVLSTPTARGTASVIKLAFDPDQPEQTNCAKYEEFLVQDFERHRVFVDIDVFMERVLHVPRKWKEDWKTTIKKIKKDPSFDAALKEYKGVCESGALEVKYYKPLVEMANAICNVAKSSRRGSVIPRTPVRYLRNDPKRMTGGVITGLSPDIVAVHENFLSDMDQEVVKDGCLYGTRLTWAQPVQLLEVKPRNGALVDGTYMPRLLANGRDPKVGHAKPGKWAKKTPPADNEGSSAACSSLEPMDETPPIKNDGPSTTCNPLKRAANEPSESSRKAPKLHDQSTPGEGTGPDGESEPRVTRTGETQEQKKAYLQVGRYLLEQFSIPAFRSHATVGLVDNHRVQFIHANHSVILVSSAIDFFADGKGEDGLDKFIAILIAFNRLTLSNSGILDRTGRGPFIENESLLESNNITEPALMQKKKTLRFKKRRKEPEFTVKYGKMISHEPSLAGRGTVVLHAKCERWKNEKLVIKISWPGVGRDAEDLFIKRATDIAKNDETHKWALNHLPKVFYARDFRFDRHSTHGKVADLFNRAKFAGDVRYEYEQRTQRIIIQERLRPLKDLTNVKDIAQVLLDVACIHRWLYEVAGILHRDLSMRNIMYRVVKGKVHGVLMDYDLSSWRKRLTSDYAKTSQQRTGTPPFMAHELLDPDVSMLHLYRHDLESLLYIMLILATHYEIGESGGIRMRQGPKGLPYQDWFNQSSYKALSSFKHSFLRGLKPLDLSPTFVGFRGWLVSLRTVFRQGLRSKEIYHEDHNPEVQMSEDYQDEGSENEVAPFDDETLGGHVCYSALIDPVAKFTGTLADLEVRYRGVTSTDSATETMS